MGPGHPQLPFSSVSGTVCSRRPAESVLGEETSSGRDGECPELRGMAGSQGGLLPGWTEPRPRSFTMPKGKRDVTSSHCRN